MCRSRSRSNRIPELDGRLESLEEAAARNAQANMFEQLVGRLDEMDEMMDIVETRTSAIAAATGDGSGVDMNAFIDQKQKADQMKVNDYSFIKSKLDMMKDHAVRVLESSSSLENLDKVMSQEERDRLENRLEAVEEVFRTIDKEQAKGNHEFSVQEYKSLLKALTTATVEVNNIHKKNDSAGSTVDAKPLYKQMADMKEFTNALDRHQNDDYGTDMDPTSAAAVYESPETRRRKEELERRREKFKAEFEAELVEHYYDTDDYLGEIDDLPEHCLMETSARNILSYSAVALLGLQLASAYLVLSLLFRIPVKSD